MLRKFAEAQVLEARDHTQPAMHLRKGAHRASFDYEPREGYVYIRSRAISSRCNDNFDEFPAPEIKKAYQTFVGKPVFVNHHNEDHRKARGVVIDAVLHEDSNPDGSPDVWAEVLMEVDAKRYPKLAEAILAGHIDRTSMGTDVEYSICSFCGNKASTPLDYCRHIPAMKGQTARRVTASGNVEEVLIREVCYGLKFFENSLLVEEPADPTAHFLDVDDRGLTRAAARRQAASKGGEYLAGFDDGYAIGIEGKDLTRPAGVDDDYWEGMQDGYASAKEDLHYRGSRKTGRIQVRPKTYRREEGWSVSGKGPFGGNISIWVRNEETARAIADLYKSVGDVDAMDYQEYRAERERVQEETSRLLLSEGSKKHAYGETKAPRDVDTLREESCPVCGDDESYDGEECSVCGYTTPPKEFQDPDLDKAKEMDLRQKNGEEPENPASTSPEEQVPGEEPVEEGEAPEDKPVEEMAPEEALEATSPQDEALLQEVNDVLTEVKKMVSPSGGDVHDEVRQQLDELREVMESGAPVEVPEEGDEEEAPEDEEAEEGDEEDEESEDEDLPDFITKDDEDKKDKKKSSKTAERSGPTVTELGRANHPDEPWAIVDEEGNVLDRFSTEDEAWGRLPDYTASKTAEKFTEGDKAWLTNWNEAQAPVTIIADPAPGTPGDGWVQVRNEESGHEYPAQRSSLSHTAVQAARPVRSTARPEQGVRRDVSEEKRMSGKKSGLKALAEATKLLKHQAKRIERLERQQAQMHRQQTRLLTLAGVGPRQSDADNPAQPVEDEGSEAPSATTDEARAADGTDDVENEGSSPVADVGADQTTDVTQPGGVVDEPLDLNEKDVTKPVDGTTEQRPRSETVTETDVRVNEDTEERDKNRDGGFLGKRGEGIEEHRLISAMRLARLRLAHDIVEPDDPRDDLALGDRIAKSDMSDQDIAHEVRTLERVTESSKKRASRKQPDRRDLVPRVASGNGDGGGEGATKRTPSFAGSSPSVSAERTVPSAAVDEEEFLFD